MATSSVSKTVSKFKDSTLGKALEEDSHFISKVFHHFDETHPQLVSAMAQRLSNTKPMMIKIPTKKAQDLTNIETITSLKEALQIAVELEMTVMFEYLFACFSVLNASDEVGKHIKTVNKEMSPYFSELRREYKSQFMIICFQEMHHMSMAIDMLISVGGRPDLQQVHFPSDFGICEEKADLIRLNLESLFMFAKNEEPYPTEESGTLVPKTPLVPASATNDDFQYYSIAQLYSAINDGFIYIHGQIGDSMFSPNPGMVPMNKAYTELQPVLDDIEIIRTEGEGGKGGELLLKIIQRIIEWIDTLVFPPGSAEDKIKQEIIVLSRTILTEIDELNKLLPDLFQLIELLEKLKVKKGISLPIDKSIFITLKSIEPSHWSRFLMMILNYVMIAQSESLEDPDDIQANFSRPSFPRPGLVGYHPITQVIVDLTNSSYHLLLKILEGSLIAVPAEMDSTYQITERYNNIKFYPIMSILIYPLGEVLSYFQLNTTGVNKTAGFPFIPISDGELILDPLEKFFDIILCLKNVYDQSVKLNQQFFDRLNECVGTWVKDPQQQETIVKRVSYTLKNIIRSIDVLYRGFSNGIPLPQTDVKSKQQPTGKRNSPPQHQDVDKFYLNIEFNGYTIYSMATDNDPTYETRGFCGSTFMFEYNNDPDFTDEFYTQNTLKQDGKTFTRDFIPKKYYKGVKVKSVSLIPPADLTEKELEKLNFAEIEKALQDDFLKNPIDFRFDPITLDGQCYFPKIDQLNYALTRQMGIDPINIGFDTDSFSISRANLLYNEKDEVVDFYTACLTCSQNFGKYPNIADDRMPKSGGYLQWANPYYANLGLLPFANQVGKCGSGQDMSDIVRILVRRTNAIMGDVNPIIAKYPNDPLVSLIPTFMKYFPDSKLICVAMMVNISDPNDKNRLSYLCTRYLNLRRLIRSGVIAARFSCLYHVPLNAPPEEDKDNHLKAVNKSKGVLSAVKFVTNQDWYTDFWIGGMDYDALTFFMTGTLMLPVFLAESKS